MIATHPGMPSHMDVVNRAPWGPEEALSAVVAAYSPLWFQNEDIGMGSCARPSLNGSGNENMTSVYVTA